MPRSAQHDEGSAQHDLVLPAWVLDPRLHILLILLVAGFFRLWQFNQFPPGLFGDEATDGLDALDVLAGRGAVFFPANYGREGLHMWIVAAAFRLLGVTPLALRLPSALAGIATALAAYWLGHELARYHLRFLGGRKPQQQSQSLPSEAEIQSAKADFALVAATSSRQATLFQQSPLAPLVALAAALYTATSFWHVHFSRFGVRGVFTPLCGALAFAALWRGLNAAEGGQARRGLAWAAAGGLFLGLSLHFYTASRFYPIFLIVFLAAQALIGREEALLRRRFWLFATVFAVAALVFLPLGLYFAGHPGSFTQRAAEVAAVGGANPLGRMLEAARANVLQFVVPGRGDAAQFYNLPRRAVFEPLTAGLAVLGALVLLRRVRHSAPLFLLTWVAVMLVPSFLATDRFPTLPRVLGVIPAVYFLPAAGLAAAAAGLWRMVGRRYAAAIALAAGLAIVLPAMLTYRDYFRVWGASAATFDAFEGDMASAARWLDDNRPAGHIFLSSDIYRHPTFMLLHERVPITRYFQHANPDLSWFDARAALPLPADGRPATYLIGGSAPARGPAADFLAQSGREIARINDPAGAPALTVLELPAGWAPPAAPAPAAAPIAFTDRLALEGAEVAATADGGRELRLRWRASGPEADQWPGYRLEIASDDWQTETGLDAFQAPEWVPGGSFITVHPLDAAVASTAGLRLRLLRRADGAPVTSPAAADGWRALP